MTASYFLDTNILVYSVDEKDKAKQRTARDLIASLVQNDDAIISTQTLQEFYNAATKKLIASKKDAGTFVSAQHAAAEAKAVIDNSSFNELVHNFLNKNQHFPTPQLASVSGVHMPELFA